MQLLQAEEPTLQPYAVYAQTLYNVCLYFRRFTDHLHWQFATVANLLLGSR